MRTFILSCLIVGLLTLSSQAQPLQFSDIMAFKAIDDPVLNAEGTWFAYTAVPDRGDAEVVVQSARSDTRYTIPLAEAPAFSADGRWVAMHKVPSLAETENADKKTSLKKGVVLFDVESGEETVLERVKQFSFAKNHPFLAIHFEVEDSGEASDEEGGESQQANGSTLRLISLGTDRHEDLEGVIAHAFSEVGALLVYAQNNTADSTVVLNVRDLVSGSENVLEQLEAGRFGDFTWQEQADVLAYVSGTSSDQKPYDQGRLMMWKGDQAEVLLEQQTLEAGWAIPVENNMSWSEDGTRLFVGLRPFAEIEPDKEEAETNPYDINQLLDKRELDVWHWNDPLINSNQKKMYEREQDRLYPAVISLENKRVVALADTLVRNVTLSESATTHIGKADVPYLKEITWGERFVDLYAVDGLTGEKALIAKRVTNDDASMSPTGNYALFYQKGDWHLYDVQAGTLSNVTEALGVSFADEDYDYPQDIPGYGVAGWMDDDSGVLIYDKYDIWMIPTSEDASYRITGGAGREAERTFRVLITDPDQDTFEKDETLLLTSYHNKEKNDGFYTAQPSGTSANRLLETPHRYSFHGRARDADVMLVSREAYDEFPDLWITNSKLENPVKRTQVNPIVEERNWGTAELVSWNSADGIPLQGVVIKPGDYDPGKKYPVMVYFYRFMSQRLHQFNQLHINHRPAFELYASNDYIIFLPDVRFEEGRPGFSAMKCIVPGVQKLIDEGIADPNAIGLHGHSWSGYQTAYIVTQTDFFTAAIAGAPVSNMTSAYGGIRWGTGLARQFQYERSQSRLGGSLWEARDHYIDNSPLFFADKINTPLLIQHGDIDGAVPWYQSIELYLAMRRLNKPGIFLQYRGEDHHLAKYPNKLDYAMKMKEYFDHFLKGAPAKSWMTDGVPYAGN